MLSIQARRRRGLSLVWGLTLTSTALVFTGATGLEGLCYQRAPLLTGEYWRLVTAHLVHLGWDHLLLNLSGLCLWWGCFGHCLNDRAWWLLSFGCTLGISLCLWAFNSGIDWYVGLSGLLHGLLAIGAVLTWRYGQADGLVWLLLLGSKVGWEQWAGPLPGSSAIAGSAVIVAAHAYGLLLGIVMAWLFPARLPVAVGRA